MLCANLDTNSAYSQWHIYTADLACVSLSVLLLCSTSASYHSSRLVHTTMSCTMRLYGKPCMLQELLQGRGFQCPVVYSTPICRKEHGHNGCVLRFGKATSATLAGSGTSEQTSRACFCMQNFYVCEPSLMEDYGKKLAARTALFRAYHHSLYLGGKRSVHARDKAACLGQSA